MSCNDCNSLETNSGLVIYSGATIVLCSGKTITNGETMTSVVEKIQYCIDVINQEIDITGVIENSPCITLLGSSIENIMQSIINTESDFCNTLAGLQTQIDNINLVISGGAAVKNTIITSYNTAFDIIESATLTDKTYKLGPFVPKKTVLPYFGTLADFDPNGAGLASAGLYGWYIADGSTHVIGGVNVTTVDACGRYLKYDCDACCTTGGANEITLEAANIPEVDFTVNADFNLSGTTEEDGLHNHNISAIAGDFDVAPATNPSIILDQHDCGGETQIYGDNDIEGGDTGNTCNNVVSVNPITPVLISGLHSHDFIANATGTFSATVGNASPTSISIEPEYISAIPIQFLGA